MDDTSNVSFIELAAQIASSYVSNNSVPPSELAGLISSIHQSLAGIGKGSAVEVDTTPKAPAVSIKKSVTQDFLICLEDGKKFKSLKRHLRTTYGLSPEDYRAKWNLPSDYPMVAPDYAAKRSALAKASGLGMQRRKAPGRPRKMKAA